MNGTKKEPLLCDFDCKNCNRERVASFYTEIEEVTVEIVCGTTGMNDSKVDTVFVGGSRSRLMAKPAVFKLLYHEDGDDYNFLLDNLKTWNLTKGDDTNEG